jgi:hypothetical protein
VAKLERLSVACPSQSPWNLSGHGQGKDKPSQPTKKMKSDKPKGAGFAYDKGSGKKG